MESNKELNQQGPSLFSRYGTQINEAYDRALRDALTKHGLLNNPVAFWEDGEVVVTRVGGVWDNDEDDVYGDLLNENVDADD